MQHENAIFKTLKYYVYSTIFLILLISPLVTHAEENPTLQNFNYGEILPSFQLKQLSSASTEVFTPGEGKPTLLLFFSIRPDFRKKRALPLLSALADISSKYKNKIKIVGIYCDNKLQQTVLKYMESSTGKIKLLADPPKDVYNKYGVFMMPLAVMTNAEGELHEVIPYTYNIRELIDGNFKLLLGEWTPDQLQSSLKPKKFKTLSEDEKEYVRRVNYGRIMLSKKMHSQAIREFSTAVKIQPKAIEAYVELGFAYNTVKEWKKALEAFKKAQSINNESDEALAGLGLAYFGQGNTNQAKAELENAFIAPDPKLDVIIALAEIYENEGNNIKANRLNKLAIKRLMTLYEQRWK